MITHLFKLIWNKKKQNFLLMTEIFFSFLVMFAVFSMMVYEYMNYRKPMGFQFDNVWTVSVNYPEAIKSADSMHRYQQTLRQLIQSMPGIKEVSFTTRNVPFSASSMSSIASYNNKASKAETYTVEDNYSKLLNVTVQEGRWFTAADDARKDKAVVINETLKEKIFGAENAIGKIINQHEMVVGVIKDFKDKGDYQDVESGLFVRADTASAWSLGSILVSVRPDAGAAVEAQLYKTISNYLNTSNLEIEHLSKKRIQKNNITLVPMIILLIVAGFLIINVALGLFGVLWYNISKRRAEIGLRRAVGATGHAIYTQLLGEALALATISLVTGSFFAVQFPLLHVFDLASAVYLIAMAFAVSFIYVLVTVCALYPGKQAAAIYPAVALHEE